MNRIKIISSVLLAFVFLATSCLQEDHELGEVLDKSEIDFEVLQDRATDPGGNTVILKNNTPGTVSMWDYGTGRSNRTQDTVRFAFKGEYVIKFSAMTAGGIVDLDPITVVVTDDNLNYVNDPLWTALSGGVGNEKTWLMDANANTESKFFTSPVYFAGMDNAYGTLAEDEQSLFWSKVCQVPDGPNCWTYEPNYKSDTWAAAAVDYGSMTFSLKGGPFVKTDHKGVSGVNTESGTFFLDVNAKTLTITDATPLTVSYGPSDAATLNNARVISLTENTMQLAFKNKSKNEYFVINYISKEYSDNWVPEDQPDPNFDFGDQSDLLAVSTSTTKTWKFDLQVPYNWTDLTGKLLNAWSTRADIVATGWAPYGDADVAKIDDASISFSADGKVVVTQDNGTSAEGTYTIDEATNMITFKDVTPSINIASWVTATTTANNQWKIVKVEKSTSGAVTGIWFGQRNSDKAEYMVFHFVLK